MRNIIASMLLLGLAACASMHSLAAEVLTTPTYRLEVIAHCPEGEVGCTQLTALLVTRATSHSVRLTGTTHMALCSDHATPCHVGYYELMGSGLKVNAYPEGTLALTKDGQHLVIEKGAWDSR